MGNPLSLFMCNIFMNNLESSMKENEIFPRLWRRYVDDVLAIVKVDRLDDVFTFINSRCDAIKFTREVELQSSLPFLDIRLTRSNGRIVFDIYRKPTSVD